MDSSRLLWVWSIHIIKRFKWLSLLQRKIVGLRWEVGRSILIMISELLMGTKQMRIDPVSSVRMQIFIWCSRCKRIKIWSIHWEHGKKLSCACRIKNCCDLAYFTNYSLERMQTFLLFLVQIFCRTLKTKVVIACQYQDILRKLVTFSTINWLLLLIAIMCLLLDVHWLLGKLLVCWKLRSCVVWGWRSSLFHAFHSFNFEF